MRPLRTPVVVFFIPWGPGLVLSGSPLRSFAMFTLLIGPGFGRTVGGSMDSLIVPIVTIPFVPGIAILSSPPAWFVFPVSRYGPSGTAHDGILNLGHSGIASVGIRPVGTHSLGSGNDSFLAKIRGLFFESLLEALFRHTIDLRCGSCSWLCRPDLSPWLQPCVPWIVVGSF